MGAHTPLIKIKDAVFTFASQTARSGLHLALAVIAYIHQNVILLGFSSHPRITCRAFVEASMSWDTFVRFIIKDCKIMRGFCSCVIMVTTLIYATTYHSDPAACQLSLVAMLAPMFGVAQASCIIWHLESTSKYPNAPFHWQKVTASNERSSFIKTASLLAAPLAWTLWSAISLIMILSVMLFRGLPVSVFNASEVSARSSNWVVEAFNPAPTYEDDGTSEALIYISLALRVCATVILTIGCIHLAITVLFFTRLCLPWEVPSAQDVPKTSTTGDFPVHSPSHSSPRPPPHSPEHLPSYSPPPSPLYTSDIAAEAPSPTELFCSPRVVISPKAIYTASATPLSFAGTQNLRVSPRRIPFKFKLDALQFYLYRHDKLLGCDVTARAPYSSRRYSVSAQSRPKGRSRSNTPHSAPF